MNNSNWHVTIIRPQGYHWSSSLSDVASALVYGLLSLGYRVSFQENDLRKDTQNIVIGSHLLPKSQWHVLAEVPVILYNLEQLPTQLAVWQGYEELLDRYPVWDYKKQHTDWLRNSRGVSATHVPLGYVPTWTRIPDNTETDIDVLFYGSLSPRRRAVIEPLEKSGIRVVTAFGAYGLTLDSLVARSRIVLNCHQYGPNDPLEDLRLYYLWANHRAVVSEIATSADIPLEWKDSALWAPYASLAQACIELLHNSPRQADMAQTAFEILTKVRFEDSLKLAIGHAVY